MQLLIPALLFGSFIQSTPAFAYNIKAVTVTRYRTIIGPVKTVFYTKTILKPPGPSDIEAYASYKGLVCISKPSKTTKKPTTTEELDCPASVTITATRECPLIKCRPDIACEEPDELEPIPWDCECEDRPPTTTYWVKPCRGCCPDIGPSRVYDRSCRKKKPVKPIKTTKPKPKPIAVGEPDPNNLDEDEEPKDDLTKEKKLTDEGDSTKVISEPDED